MLGGSTAHLPIKPNNKIVMLRGAATAIHDKELFEGNITISPANKKGNYMRTVKATFKSSPNNALHDGITLHQHNLHQEKLLTQPSMHGNESSTFEFNLRLHDRLWDDIRSLTHNR